MKKSTILRSVLMVHLLRGMVGIGLLAGAFWLAGISPWLALLATIGGFVALRGCPMCWLAGFCSVMPSRSGSYALPDEKGA